MQGCSLDGNQAIFGHCITPAHTAYKQQVAWQLPNSRQPTYIIHQPHTVGKVNWESASTEESKHLSVGNQVGSSTDQQRLLPVAYLQPHHIQPQGDKGNLGKGITLPQSLSEEEELFLAEQKMLLSHSTASMRASGISLSLASSLARNKHEKVWRVQLQILSRLYIIHKYFGNAVLIALFPTLL